MNSDWILRLTTFNFGFRVCSFSTFFHSLFCHLCVSFRFRLECSVRKKRKEKKRKERIVVSHLGEKRKEMILVSHHHVWMTKKENRVRWGYERDLFVFICILKGNFGIGNYTQPIIFVFFHFHQILPFLMRNKIGLVSDFSLSPFLTPSYHFQSIL